MKNNNTPQITDLSFLDAEDIKIENTKFLIDSEQDYESGTEDVEHRLRHRIWVTRNGDIRKIFYQFPFDESLHDQCALWMQALVGKHFFPDANHRTAVVILRDVLSQNGIQPGPWDPDKTHRTRKESHEVRKEHPPITLADIYQRDPLYEVRRSYFNDVLII